MSRLPAATCCGSYPPRLLQRPKERPTTSPGISKLFGTVGEAVLWAESILEKAGVALPSVEAGDLASRILGLSRTEVALESERLMSGSERVAFRGVVARRRRREPFGYIFGRAPFLDMELEVGPGVMVPRPETELLAELALRRLAKLDEDTLAADIGTGCGGIALALARLGSSRVVATDVSSKALAVAKRNVDRYGQGGRIRLMRGWMWNPLAAAALAGRFALIVSNPPYVAWPEWDALPAEVRLYEPRLALDGGSDGMTWYRILFGRARVFLKNGGALMLEVGGGRGRVAEGLARQAGFRKVALVRDGAGKERVLIAESFLM